MQSSTKEDTNTRSGFNYGEFYPAEIKKVGDCSTRKEIRLVKLRCLDKIWYGTLPSELPPNATKKAVATATSEELTHEIQGSNDWTSVKEVVASWVREAKNVRVDLRVDYVKPRVRADGKEEIYTSDVEEPSRRCEADSTTTTGQAAEKGNYKLTTATQILLDEMAVESSSQSSREFITSIMQEH